MPNGSTAFREQPWVQRLRAWAAEPESVFDGPMEKALRQIASVIGLDSPTGEVLGMMSGMETGPAGGIAGALGKLVDRVRSRGLYSRVDEAAKLIPASGAHPNRVASVLKSNASAEELQYRKVPEFLAGLGNQPVTPEALRAHLAAHPAPMPVVKTLGHSGKGFQVVPSSTLPADTLIAYGDDVPPFAVVSPEGREIGLYPTAESAREAIEELPSLGIHPGPSPKFQQYTVPGGEQYRETLLTLPTDEMAPGFSVFKADDGTWGVQFPDGLRNTGWNTREAAIRSQRRQSGAPVYQSSHFDEPNIVAHARSNVRTLPTGERGRFIEEVQSDWHQAGKRKGYNDPVRKAEHEARAVKASMAHAEASRAKADAFSSLRDYVELHGKQPYEGGPPEYRRLVDAYNSATDRADRAQLEWDDVSSQLWGGVPDAPFKDSWPDLALKQQLLEAVDDPDTSWIGFTAGQTQADRYNLAKQVDSIWVNKLNDGSFHVAARKADELVIPTRAVKDAAELEGLVGKELAEKATAIAPGGEQTFSGLDLQVGGAGMRKFYDELLPKRLEKIVKPFGGKVERAPVSAFGEKMDLDVPAFSVRDQDGNMRGIWENRADAEAYLATPPDFIDPARSTIVPATTVRSRMAASESPSWIVRLTPEMKAKIKAAGLPLMAIPFAVSPEQERE